MEVIIFAAFCFVFSLGAVIYAFRPSKAEKQMKRK